jgi:hypothetical protein
MNVTLPAVWTFPQQGTHANGWGDHYGALHVAADYAGLELPAVFTMRGFWQHGVSETWAKRVPSTLVYNLEISATPPFLVARADEVECLRRAGYDGARAIGLPMLYLRQPPRPRTPRSLLIVPTHTLVGDFYPERSEFEAYANEMAAVAKDFDHVVVCIHPNCRKNGLWITEFASRGIQIVYGAQTNDRNALVRMKGLFEQFECVTTNGWGSHVPYALACGAKVSIYGTEPVVRAENLLKDGTWIKNVEALTKMFSREVQMEKLAYIRRFQVKPTKGVLDVQLGQWFLGESHRLSPAEMRSLLCDLITPTPVAAEPTVVAAIKQFQTDGNDAKSCLQLALRALRTNRVVEAQALFDHAVILTPEDAAVHLGRGLLFARSRRLDEAESSLRLAHQLDPSSVEAARFLAQLCRARGRHAESGELYQKIISLRPNDAEALTALSALAPAV